MHPIFYEDAQKRYVHGFLSQTSWRFHYCRGVVSYGEDTVSIQKHMKHKLLFNNFRHEHLREALMREMFDYLGDLQISKKPEDIEIYEMRHNLQEDLLEDLVALYLERCKFKNSLAFFQYRNNE